MVHVGIDGCRLGWLCVAVRADGTFAVDVWETAKLGELLDSFSNSPSVFIDMPIGFIDHGAKPRMADAQARRLLGKRSCTIFSPPCRAAVHAPDNEEAKRLNQEHTQKSLSIQTLSIRNRIALIDNYLISNPSRRDRLREFHPEIAFFFLNDRKPLERKKTAAGAKTRASICANLFPQTSDLIDFASRKFTRREVSRDDILDALVGAIISLNGAANLRSLPNPRLDGAGSDPIPAYDSVGIPMQIWYSELLPDFARCGFCDMELDRFFWSYKTAVCKQCERRSVNSEGKPPTHNPSADAGDNPIFIDGQKCWRRYKFGGYVTMRDPYDSPDYRAFVSRIFGPENFS